MPTRTSAVRHRSNFVGINGMSYFSDRSDVANFLGLALGDHPSASLSGHELHAVVNQSSLLPTGDWVLNVTNEQAASGCIGQLQRNGDTKRVGSSTVRVKRMHEGEAKNRVAAARVKVTVPSRTEALWQVYKEDPTQVGDVALASAAKKLKETDTFEIKLDCRTVRCFNLPMHFGIDEVEFLFRGASPPTPPRPPGPVRGSLIRRCTFSEAPPARGLLATSAVHQLSSRLSLLCLFPFIGRVGSILCRVFPGQGSPCDRHDCGTGYQKHRDGPLFGAFRVRGRSDPRAVGCGFFSRGRPA